MLFLRRFASLALGMSLLFASASPVTLAADHRESPTADGAPEGDITDFFTFLDPNDPTQLVLIMNVNPFSVPAESASYRFSTDFLYQFKIANDGVAREDLVVQAIFKNDATCPSGQRVLVFGPERPRIIGARNVLASEHASVAGCTGGILTASNGMQVFTGLRDDPFAFDVGQFFRILGGRQEVFRDIPNTPLGHLRGRSVRPDTSSGVDGFGGFNVTSIAIELPKHLVRGKTSRLQLWATVGAATSKARNDGDDDDRSFQGDDDDRSFQQFQRVGQQVFKTVFVPTNMRDAFNATVPEDDVKNWSSLVPNALTSNDAGGNTIAARFDLLNSLGLFALPNGAPNLLPRDFQNTDANFLRGALIPDVLRFDLDLAPNDLAIGQFGLQNGRRPADAVVPILLRIARQLGDVDFAGSGRKGALNFPLNNLAVADRRVFVLLQGTDFIKPDAQTPDLTTSGNDRPFLTVFPFLATPHPFPGDAGTVGFPAQQ